MSTTQSLPILLLLDLATDNPIAEKELLEHLPEDEQSRLLRLRLSDFGAVASRTGAPGDWYGCATAVVNMVQAARRHADEAGTTPLFYVAGRAALPLFAVLGCELSGWANATVLNRRRDPPIWDVLALGRGARPFSGDERFFQERTGLDAVQQAEGRVAVVVSTAPPRQDNAAASYMMLQGEPQAGLIRLSAHVQTATGPEWRALDKSNVTRAAHEIEQAFSALPAQFPNHRGAAVFIDGPASLAFLVGRALNPNVLGPYSTWIPNFHREGGGYHDAVTLPHRPRPRAGTDGAVPMAILASERDDLFTSTLETCLAPKVRAGKVRLWHRGMIEAGKSMDDATRTALEEAQIVVTLVSAELLSDNLLLSHAERLAVSQGVTGKRMIPLLVRACSLADTRLENTQVLPRNGVPIDSWTKPAEAWKTVQDELHPIVQTALEARKKGGGPV